MDWLVAFLMVCPAVYFYFNRSSWIIDYLVWVTVLNRGIRRVVDWMAGAFNPFSPISLTPLVISGLVFLLFFPAMNRLPSGVKRVFQLFGVALALGLMVGLVRNQLAAVYALAEYLGPLAIMGCAALAGGNEKVLDRWIKSIGWAAVTVSAYGWYQYFTIPPWDAFWVRAVGFEGYLGQLEATKMTVFSTMGERGVLGGFLAFAVVPMIVSKRWRNAMGWLSVVLILSIVLLTFVRTAVIFIGLATVMFPVLNRGKNTIQIVLLLAVVAVAANFGLSQIPTGEQISKRLGTLSSVADDGSFKGRVEIAAYGLGVVLSNPLGLGLGSSGLAGRVNTGTLESNAAIGDNGYFSLMFAFGWIGGFCFFYAFYLMWRRVGEIERMGIRSESLMMFKALMVTGAITLLAGDWVSSPGAITFFIFAGFAINPLRALKAMRERAAVVRGVTGQTGGGSCALPLR